MRSVRIWECKQHQLIWWFVFQNKRDRTGAAYILIILIIIKYISRAYNIYKTLSLLRLLFLNIFPYSVVYYFPHTGLSTMRPNLILRAVARKRGGRRKWLWLWKWSQFHAEKTTITKILCSIHLWWFQQSLQHLTILSTTKYVEVSLQILDTPTKRKLSFCSKDNCFSLSKNRHKLYLDLKINMTNLNYSHLS